MKEKLTENFYLHEFVTKDLHKKWKGRAVIFLDDRIIYLAQWIRARFGKPMVVNTWKTEKDGWNYRGWRPANCSVGARNSQHKSGRGLDLHIEGVHIEEIYDDIWENEGTYYSYGLRCVEDISKTPTWLHIDCRTTFTDYKVLKV